MTNTEKLALARTLNADLNRAEEMLNEPHDPTAPLGWLLERKDAAWDWRERLTAELSELAES